MYFYYFMLKRQLVRYHIYHHCKYTETCFGVTMPWWDDLFKTIPKAPAISQRIIDFYFKGDEIKQAPSKISNCKLKTDNCQNNCIRKENCRQLRISQF